MIFAGVFDRFPELRVITGHWGEMLLFYLDRIDQLVGAAGSPANRRSTSGTNVFVTPVAS